MTLRVESLKKSSYINKEGVFILSKSKRKRKGKDLPKTISEMSGSRGTWGSVKPITKIVPDKTKYKRKVKHKKLDFSF